MKPLPNRLAVYFTAAGALIAGLLPLVGNLDWESTAGIMAGIGSITGVVAVWLYNWGKYERLEGPGILPADELDLEPPYDELVDDGFDEASAEPIPPTVAEAAHTPDVGTTYTPAPDELEAEPLPPAVPPPGPRPERSRRRSGPEDSRP